MKENNLSFKDSFMSKIILKDSVTDEYFKIGTGPFNDFAKMEIFARLMKAEKEFNKFQKEYVKLHN